MSIISKDIAKAATLLRNNELVAIPTETVYGLAGNIYSETAIKAIFSTKQRPLYNPLIVHIASVAQLPNIAKHIPEKAQQLANNFWPGALTLVLPKQDNIPDIITAGKPTVAVRVPNHSVAQELLNTLEFPLAAPSANPFSCISPTKATHVERYFKTSIKMVLDGGACTKGIESTIVGFHGDTPVIYRLGAVSQDAIESVVGKVLVKNTIKTESNISAPGMLSKHYAPRTRTVLTSNVIKSIEEYPNKKLGLLTFKDTLPAIAQLKKQITLSKTGDMAEAMFKLYDALHQLDHEALDLIIVEAFPKRGLGNSINDRLKRASS